MVISFAQSVHEFKATDRDSFFMLLTLVSFWWRYIWHHAKATSEHWLLPFPNYNSSDAFLLLYVGFFIISLEQFHENCLTVCSRLQQCLLLRQNFAKSLRVYAALCPLFRENNLVDVCSLQGKWIPWITSMCRGGDDSLKFSSISALAMEFNRIASECLHSAHSSSGSPRAGP